MGNWITQYCKTISAFIWALGPQGDIDNRVLGYRSFAGDGRAEFFCLVFFSTVGICRYCTRKSVMAHKTSPDDGEIEPLQWHWSHWLRNGTVLPPWQKDKRKVAKR